MLRTQVLRIGNEGKEKFTITEDVEKVCQSLIFICLSTSLKRRYAKKYSLFFSNMLIDVNRFFVVPKKLLKNGSLGHKFLPQTFHTTGFFNRD